MKNRYSLLIVGAMLTMAWGCHSSPSPKATTAPNTNQNPNQSDNEDEDVDDGTYGDKDTSSQRESQDASPTFPTDPVAEINMQQTLVDQAIQDAAVALVDSLASAEEEENAPIVLEAVEPVEFPSEVVMAEESEE